MHALQESENSETLYQSEPLDPALFLERPNRFTVLFQKGGRWGIAFLANPGRLQEILLPARNCCWPDSVERFGCSDCRCGSHLFYFEDPPHRLPQFQEVLTRLRHQAALG